jgi:Zn-dependent protease with chaperone function
MQPQDAGFANRPLGADLSKPAIVVAPHAAETPLRVVLMIVGVVLWILIAVSVVGLLYGVLLGLFFFFVHLSLIAHIRGSSIKLGPQQMPHIHARVLELARRIGMERVPDVYLLQSGGVLNAFATRFMRARFVVLYSELVKACGDNTDALDFIIAHELGHIHRGHLSWRWLLAPALFVPFLGTAYSRACEYTCDRYGFQASSDSNRSLGGLCILAAGPQFVSMVDWRQFAEQDRDLETAFMKLGGWFATHPPLALRLAALSPDLKPAGSGSALATVGALAIALALFVVPIGGGVFFINKSMKDLQSKIAAQPNAARLPAR